MSIDLGKLTPAPWDVGGDLHLGPGKGWSTSKADFAFIALARNAFDVMMRRGWFPFERFAGLWSVGWQHHRGPFNAALSDFCDQSGFQDPFTALVAADAWLTEREKA